MNKKILIGFIRFIDENIMFYRRQNGENLPVLWHSLLTGELRDKEVLVIFLKKFNDQVNGSDYAIV
jgi:hypothetical protein